MDKTKIICYSILALAIVVCSTILVNGFINRNKTENVITVTGLGSKDFTSDLIVWNASFSRKSATVSDASNALSADYEKIKAYLLANGIKENEFVFSSISINEMYNSYYDDNNHWINSFSGYNLSQSVTITSNDIEKVENISRDITKLINKGIMLESESPSYYYTKTSELKMQLLEEASKDARLRAEIIAENSNGKLGKLKTANMGIFQIIAKNSNEDYSWGGSYNTSSKEKTATITMKLQYELK